MELNVAPLSTSVALTFDQLIFARYTIQQLIVSWTFGKFVTKIDVQKRQPFRIFGGNKLFVSKCQRVKLQVIDRF